MTERAQRALVWLALAVVPIPFGWPHHVALGVADPPGGARQLMRHAPFDARYQYLAGGVNTGHGWAAWDPHGSFATSYVSESLAAHTIPVLTYYQLLQSRPSRGANESARDISNLRNPRTMRAYWADWKSLLRRVASAAGAHPAVIHVEPDLWGYLEQAGAVKLALGFAQRLIALRNQLAPHVLLAFHLSSWGTNEDFVYSKPSLAHMDELGARSASFYEALHARFDLVFSDVADRDAGYYQVIEHNPHMAWSAADFARYNAYLAGFTRRTHAPVVLWQLPLGNTLLRNTWGHFRDNRVQWWLGNGSLAHLRATRAAGVIGLLFGGGATGTTSAQTDGGLFYRLARRYLKHPLGLGQA